MVDRVAAILAGIPARIINEVLASVREAIPDLVVVRGRGARSYSNRLASYPMEYVAEIVDLAADAIFGQSGRSKGFCRNPQRTCLKSSWAKSNCGANGDLSCGREKPEKFVIFIQEADEEGIGQLVEVFNNTAFFIIIPRDSYDHLGRTSDFIINSIAQLEDDLAAAAANVKSGSPALLLPVRNFGNRDLKRLVKQAVRVPTTRSALRAFRRQFFKDEAYFLGRSRLAFQPTVEATAHGTPTSDEDKIAAIAAHYRAGCRFDDFHWDVYPSGEKGWGNVTISCREKGDHKPDGKHVNVLVDDKVR